MPSDRPLTVVAVDDVADAATIAYRRRLLQPCWSPRNCCCCCCCYYCYYCCCCYRWRTPRSATSSANADWQSTWWLLRPSLEHPIQLGPEQRQSDWETNRATMSTKTPAWHKKCRLIIHKWQMRKLQCACVNLVKERKDFRFGSKRSNSYENSDRTGRDMRSDWEWKRTKRR